MTNTLNSKFDLGKLRITNQDIMSDVTKVLQTIPVTKPNKQHFIRAHKDDNYVIQVGLIEIKEDNEYYLITNLELCRTVREIEAHHLHLCINRQEQLFFWPLKIPRADSRSNNWDATRGMALRLAKEAWIRVVPNMNTQSYDVLQAKAELSDPVWPDESLEKLLEIAFQKNIIHDENHHVIKKLQGMI